MTLPADLASAEQELVPALASALAADGAGRWTVELRFEGLRLAPVALRLQTALTEGGRCCRLLFADAGATALAQRDAPTLADRCHSLADWQRRPPAGATDDLLLLVAPGPPDYEAVKTIAGAHAGALVLLNGRLEDAGVGIGSVARDRRRGFLAVWRSAYALQPLLGAALAHAHPGPWRLYRLDPDGYRPLATFEERPTAEDVDGALLGPQEGVRQGLRGLERLVNDLGR
ncbi:MAG: DUF1995 family protein [Cyanobacteriota bacterium]